MSTDLTRFVDEHRLSHELLTAQVPRVDCRQGAHNDARLLNQASNDVSAKSFGDSEINFSYTSSTFCFSTFFVVNDGSFPL